MNNKDLTSRVAEELEIRPTEADKLLRAFSSTLQQILSEGNEVKIEGLGKFVPQVRRKSWKRNNLTGSVDMIGPHIDVKFRQFSSSKQSLLQMCPVAEQFLNEDPGEKPE